MWTESRGRDTGGEVSGKIFTPIRPGYTTMRCDSGGLIFIAAHDRDLGLHLPDW